MKRRARKPKGSYKNKRVLKPSEQSSQSDVLNHSVGAVRTLYFHTGAHKTGSKALQAYLAANIELLEKAGISYEFPVGYENDRKWEWTSQ